MNEKFIGRIFHESMASEEVRSVKKLGSNVARMVVVLQDADAPNRNGRIYPKKHLELALQHSFIKEKLATNSLAGESNHPDPKLGLGRQMTIDMNNISHFIKRTWWEGNLLLGEVETSANTIGKDLAAMVLENGMVCSFSMRGSGDVVRKGGMDVVDKNLRIITWDNVHYPSHEVAYMRSLSEKNEAHGVTLPMLSEYVASLSQNTEILTESIQNELGCFGNVNFSVNSGKVIITEASTNRPLGFAKLEKSLDLEFKSALRQF